MGQRGMSSTTFESLSLVASAPEPFPGASAPGWAEHAKGSGRPAVAPPYHVTRQAHSSLTSPGALRAHIVQWRAAASPTATWTRSRSQAAPRCTGSPPLGAASGSAVGRGRLCQQRIIHARQELEAVPFSTSVPGGPGGRPRPRAVAPRKVRKEGYGPWPQHLDLAPKTQWGDDHIHSAEVCNPPLIVYTGSAEAEGTRITRIGRCKLLPRCPLTQV